MRQDNLCISGSSLLTNIKISLRTFGTQTDGSHPSIFDADYLWGQDVSSAVLESSQVVPILLVWQPHFEKEHCHRSTSTWSVTKRKADAIHFALYIIKKIISIAIILEPIILLHAVLFCFKTLNFFLLMHMLES